MAPKGTAATGFPMQVQRQDAEHTAGDGTLRHLPARTLRTLPGREHCRTDEPGLRFWPQPGDRWS